MTDETKSEIIKAFAYGFTPEEVAQSEGMTLEDAKAFKIANVSAITERENLLKEEGWY